MSKMQLSHAQRVERRKKLIFAKNRDTRAIVHAIDKVLAEAAKPESVYNSGELAHLSNARHQISDVSLGIVRPRR